MKSPLGFLVVLFAGCAGPQLASPPVPCAGPCAPPAPRTVPAADSYRLAMPDALEVRFPTRPEWDTLATVDLDGRIALGQVGRPIVAGATVEEVQQQIAQLAELPRDQVQVSIAEYRSARIYLSGPENDRQSVWAYRGPETVYDFLLRAKAIRPGMTDLHAVRVLRPNVAAGHPPLEYFIDLSQTPRAGTENGQFQLHASDEVLVGETRQSRFARVLPKWLRPIYEPFRTDE